MSADNPTRRDFMRASIAAGAGLTLAVYLPSCSPRAAVVSGPPFVPNAWLRIGTDGVVTVVVDKSEMGQGVLTSLPQMIMEELDGDWATVRIEEAPAGPQYVNPAFGLQGTGGSTSVRVSMMPLREAGAKARAMLVAAAAQKWGIAPDACSTANGYVLETGKRRKLGYGELTVAAAAMPVPEKVTLKDPKDFKLIGKPVKRLDLKGKVNGTAGFGIDAHTDGMLVAVVARAPVLGSSVTGFDDKPALAVPGVKRVVQVDSGVAVVATGYWAAMKGREALQVSWSKSPMAGVSSADLSARFKALSAKPGVKARHDGDPAGALRRASKRVDATYEVPYLAHATMEPMNCTAWVQADKCTVWAPTQFQSGGGLGVQGIAAKLTGLPESAVTVHTTFLGGGFGRRFELDFVIDAVQVSRAIAGPVKVIWSREDDVRHDYFRPASYSKLAAGLDASGKPVAWSQTIVCPSIMSRFAMVYGPLPNGLDASSVEGAANIAYAIPNLHCGWVNADLGVPIGFWRSVGNSQNAFVAEGFMDEVAHAAGADPYEFRRNLLAGAPRHRGVLELAATKAGWGTPLPEGRALASRWWSRSAAMSPKWRRYPSRTARSGCIAWSAPWTAGWSSIPTSSRRRWRRRGVRPDGRALREDHAGERRRRAGELRQLPDAADERDAGGGSAHLAEHGGAGGIGEPGTPPIAPAVVNAIFALTGQRIRSLPIVLQQQKA